MFHIRVVAQFLWMVFDECQKTNTCFLAKLQAGDRTLEHLKRLREQFHEGGEERMENLEKQWTAICTEIYVEEEKKREEKPARIDIHTLKHVLEFGQECKRLGNEKFREGLYEEALQIYSQGDELMKKWCCSDQWKNESKWLKDYHLACLKNKAQAALRLEMFSTALEAAEAALRLDVEDHKAWYRKVQAYKGLGKFDEAEEALVRLEDVAQWCPDRQNILRDCDVEKKRLLHARAKHKQDTQEMLGKAFDAEVFSSDRDRAQRIETEAREAAMAKQKEEEKVVRSIKPAKPL
jgi:tetratricopeptide (TPR) repeat protein